MDAGTRMRIQWGEPTNLHKQKDKSEQVRSEWVELFCGLLYSSGPSSYRNYTPILSKYFAQECAALLESHCFEHIFKHKIIDVVWAVLIITTSWTT